MELKDRVALVTGGTRGIGAACAIDLASAGCHVAIAARRMDAEAKRLRDQIAQLGRKCVLIGADLAKPAEATRCVSDAAAQLGAVDVLVHSAGGPVPGRIEEITPETWHGAFDIHVHAVFHLARAVIPEMKRKKRGAIILVSSVAGKLGLRTNIAYQVVKGALPHFCRALACELADDNIRVNAVAPGVIWTDFHTGASSQWRQNNLDNRIPLHREGTPQQVASLIRELATNDYITGETVMVDGGLTMRIC